jgi:hypothetical protein
MTYYVFVFTILLTLMLWRQAAPLAVAGLSFTIALIPIVTGIVSYRYFSPLSSYNVLFILIFMIFLNVGYFYNEQKNKIVVLSTKKFGQKFEKERHFKHAKSVTNFLWWISILATLSIIVDFILYRNAELSDLSNLRSNYVNQEKVSIFAQFSSVTSWATLYCYLFSIIFRSRLKISQIILYSAPILSFFLNSLLSAGRQSAFQIALVTILAFFATSRVKNSRKFILQSRNNFSQISYSGLFIILFILITMISYMGYVAFARNDGAISGDKVNVLSTLFDFEISDWFDSFIIIFPPIVKTTIVEGVTYFSSTVPLFSMFMDVEWSRFYSGAMTFPFIFRQMEPITSISVIGGLREKISEMQSLGVIGVGWTTGFSSFIMDFGFIGALLFTSILGWICSNIWNNAVNLTSPYALIAGICILVWMVYLPLFPAMSDNTFLLLPIFCILADKYFNKG